MAAIRAEDDMALESSTMARVFVNRWMLMTGHHPLSRNPPRIQPSSTQPSMFPSVFLPVSPSLCPFSALIPPVPTTYPFAYNPSRFQLINYANLRDSCRSNSRNHPFPSELNVFGGERLFDLPWYAYMFVVGISKLFCTSERSTWYGINICLP